MENKDIIILFLLIIVLYFIQDCKNSAKAIENITENFVNNTTSNNSNSIQNYEHYIDKYLEDRKNISIVESINYLQILANKIQNLEFLQIPGNFDVYHNFKVLGDTFTGEIGTIIMWGKDDPPYPNTKKNSYFNLYNNFTIDINVPPQDGDGTNNFILKLPINLDIDLNNYDLPFGRFDVNENPKLQFEISKQIDSNNIIEIKRKDANNIGKGWDISFTFPITLKEDLRDVDNIYWAPCTGVRYHGMTTPNLKDALPIGAGYLPDGRGGIIYPKRGNTGGYIPFRKHKHSISHTHDLNFFNDDFNAGYNGKGIGLEDDASRNLSGYNNFTMFTTDMIDGPPYGEGNNWDKVHAGKNYAEGPRGSYPSQRYFDGYNSNSPRMHISDPEGIDTDSKYTQENIPNATGIQFWMRVK